MTAAEQLRWDEIEAVQRSPELALGYAAALIGIVGRTYQREAFGIPIMDPMCPHCFECESRGHVLTCAWLAAARALGISD